MPARIVIASRSRFLGRAVQHRLEGSAVQTVAAQSTAELIDAVRAANADCVIIDAELVGGKWAECCRQIRAMYPDRAFGVIFLAERPTREFVREAVGAGATEVLVQQPQVVEMLLRKLRSLGFGAECTRSAPGAALTATPAGSPGAAAEASPVPSGPCDDGDPAEALAELSASGPLVSRQRLLDLIDGRAALRALSPVAQQVVALSDSATASVDDIARVINQDAAICVKILRLANSSAYAGGRRVDSVARAVARIGMVQARQTVLNLEIIDRFSGVRCGRIRSDWFWEHSIAVGLIASRLARRADLGAQAADALFTAGLLHDVGRMLLAEAIPKRYEVVIDTAERLGVPLEIVESKLLSTTHADVTSRVLRSWNLPREIVDPIASHHIGAGRSRRAPSRAREPGGILSLADRLAHALLIGSSGNDAIYPTREQLRAMDLEAGLIDDVCTSVPGETGDMRMVLAERAGAGDSARFDQSVRERIAAAGTLLSISGDPGFDPLERLVWRLNAGRTQAPGAAAVYIHGPSEPSRVAAELAERETGLGIGPLPTVVMGTADALPLAAGPFAGRSVRLLRCPTTLGRFVDAVAALAVPQPPPRP